MKFHKKEMASKKIFIVFIFMFIAIVFPIAYHMNKTSNTKNFYYLNEPMLISSSKGEPYYMIPAKTLLQFEQGFPEGHQLYTIRVFSKGKLPATQIPSSASVESTWLYPIDADDISTVLQKYPLSKDDLIRILKARKMTRDDLVQIAREWKDE